MADRFPVSNDDDLNDETTPFGAAPVDGLVFIPSADSPELRMKPAASAMPSPNYRPVTPRRSTPRGPTTPWTPGPQGEADLNRSRAHWSPLRLLVATGLACLPIAAGLWIVRLGLNLYGG